MLAPYLFGENFTSGSVIAIRPDGTLSEVARVVGFEDPDDDGHGHDHFVTPIGATFAPVGFGAVASDLLVSDSEESGKIFAVESDGRVRLFTRIPVLGNQFGPRQMAFSGADFKGLESMLFVSVACCAEDATGVKDPGALYALDTTGRIRS